MRISIRTFIVAMFLVLWLSACNSTLFAPASHSGLNQPSENAQTVIQNTTTVQPDATVMTLPTPTIPATQIGYGSIEGIVTNAFSIFPDQEVQVYSAAVYGNPENKEGFYVLEPNIFPHAMLENNGHFKIFNVKPGYYVLLVGPKPEQVIVVMDGAKARIIEVKESELIVIGEIKISP